MAEKINKFLLQGFPQNKRVELAFLLLLPRRLRDRVDDVKLEGERAVVYTSDSTAAQEIVTYITAEFLSRLRAAAGVKKLRRIVVR